MREGRLKSPSLFLHDVRGDPDDLARDSQRIIPSVDAHLYGAVPVAFLGFQLGLLYEHFRIFHQRYGGFIGPDAAGAF